jgi:hypothetical protein
MPTLVSLVTLTLAVWCIGDGVDGTRYGQRWSATARWLQVLAASSAAWWFGESLVHQMVLCLSLLGGATLIDQAYRAVGAFTLRIAPTDHPALNAATVMPAAADLPTIEAPARPLPARERRGVGIVQHVAEVSAFAIKASGRTRRRATDGAFADREVPRPPSVTPLADGVRNPDEVIGPRRPTPPRPAFGGTVWR